MTVMVGVFPREGKSSLLFFPRASLSWAPGSRLLVFDERLNQSTCTLYKKSPSDRSVRLLSLITRDKSDTIPYQVSLDEDASTSTAYHCAPFIFTSLFGPRFCKVGGSQWDSERHVLSYCACSKTAMHKKA